MLSFTLSPVQPTLMKNRHVSSSYFAFLPQPPHARKSAIDFTRKLSCTNKIKSENTHSILTARSQGRPRLFAHQATMTTAENYESNQESSSDAHEIQATVTEPVQLCSYCQNDKEVSCPVCDGRGYHGRTITCYYCKGRQIIECPLCIDDNYRFSYVATEKKEPPERGQS